MGYTRASPSFPQRTYNNCPATSSMSPVSPYAQQTGQPYGLYLYLYVIKFLTQLHMRATTFILVYAVPEPITVAPAV
jgi:hypothetical protein